MPRTTSPSPGTRPLRGYDPDHPRIDLLRPRRLAAARRWPVQPWMHTMAAYGRLTDAWREARPIAAWLEARVGVAPSAGRRRRQRVAGLVGAGVPSGRSGGIA